MTRELAIMAGIAGVAGVLGLITLVRPGIVRGWLGMPEGEPALYALRIAGMMLFAFGLFLGGFATVGTLVGIGAA